MDIFQGYEEIFNGFLYSGMKKTQPTARREGGWGGGGGGIVALIRLDQIAPTLKLVGEIKVTQKL